MDLNRMERIMEAREYQKKAIKALLPESMQGHVEVIETELKEMVKEGIVELLSSEQGMEFIKGMMNTVHADRKSDKEPDTETDKSRDNFESDKEKGKGKEKEKGKEKDKEMMNRNSKVKKVTII